MKKFFAALLAMLFVFSLPGGCSRQGNSNNGFGCAGSGGNQGFNAEREIYVVSREDGSGTRGAFIELFGIEYKNEDGTIRKDLTTKEAIIADKTDVVMTNVSNSPYVIGYISLGSVNDTVKALQVDGVSISVENIQSGAYKIQRPINIAYKELTEPAEDFIDFILSQEGQSVVAANDYVPVKENAPHYSGNMPSGKIVVAGSSSVTPVMEKLREAYLVLNPGVTIEVQLSDSTAGMNAAINGTCDIGMASRDLKESEKAELTGLAVALDGLAIVVHNDNPLQGLTSEQIRSIFTGETTRWSELNGETFDEQSV